MQNKNNKYTKMQLNYYNAEAANWSESLRDPVVGLFDEHNNWHGYENLFLNLKNNDELIGLDFGCGPGRNIVKYHNRFKRLDGADISPINIRNAKYVTKNRFIETTLYVTSGIYLDNVPSDKYDFVMSTITFQHICVYDIRYSIMNDIYRVLKKGGVFTFQMGMGFHPDAKRIISYYENYYDANLTNGWNDVYVESPDQLKKDLLKIGFTEFNYTITPTGPGSANHEKWIFVNCKK